MSTSDRPLNPMADIFVRYLLGSEEHKNILINFINAVFAHKGHDLVVEIEILNPFNLKTIQTSKESILDVKARDSNGRWINVEIQIDPDGSFANRSLYYRAKSYAGQLKTGDGYGDLNPAISINLLDFAIFPQLPGYHSCFQLTEVDAPEYVLSEHMQMHYIELPKNRLRSSEEVKNKLDGWCYYFKNEGKLEEDDMTVLLKDNPALGDAHKAYRDFTTNDELMDMAEAHEKWRKDVSTKLRNAKREGKIEDARKMRDRGFAIADIADITGLSEQEIREL